MYMPEAIRPIGRPELHWRRTSRNLFQPNLVGALTQKNSVMHVILILIKQDLYCVRLGV